MLIIKNKKMLKNEINENKALSIARVSDSADIKEKFDFNTIQDFDKHIDLSIPNFNVLIDSTKSLAEYFYVKDTNIYDLGCSTGKLLNSISTDCQKIGYDSSNLLPKEEGFYCVDLNENFKIENASVVFSIFTMQFLEPDKRKDYLKTIYDGLNSGGAFFISEKTYRKDGKMQELMSFAHYDYKLKHFSAEEIFSKERDLRLIMKPLKEEVLYSELQSVGFEICIYWHVFNFVGIICLKK